MHIKQPGSSEYRFATAVVDISTFVKKHSAESSADFRISKGDGFIWIKRKHYFQPELNADFFRRLDRGATR